MAKVFIGVGSNEGERLENISKAIQAFSSVGGIRLMQMATILETAPIGGPPQGPYLNTVVEIETSLEPAALLAMLKRVESQLGRLPSTERWGPRPIDLDLLFYDDRIIHEATLILPHPRLHERPFVLEPLSQLAPDLLHPVLGQTIATLCERLQSLHQ